MVLVFKNCFAVVCLSGRRRLEVRGHGGGQSISLGIHSPLCAWDCRAFCTATIGEHRKILRVYFPCSFSSLWVTHLFCVPYNKERDLKLSTQASHLLKLMVRWKRGLYCQLGARVLSLVAQRSVLRCFIILEPGAGSTIGYMLGFHGCD